MDTTNFFGVLTDWIKGTKTPNIQTTIGLEDATLLKTAGYLSFITVLFLGGLKLVLDSSLKKHARHMGFQI